MNFLHRIQTRDPPKRRLIGYFFLQNGNLVEDLVIYFSRPYPMATAGSPYKLSFDIKTRIFEFQFYPNPAVKHPTEIFVPPLHYPAKSYSVATSKNLKWTPGPDNILLVFSGAAANSDKIEFVRITPI